MVVDPGETGLNEKQLLTEKNTELLLKSMDILLL